MFDTEHGNLTLDHPHLLEISVQYSCPRHFKLLSLKLPGGHAFQCPQNQQTGIQEKLS